MIELAKPEEKKIKKSQEKNMKYEVVGTDVMFNHNIIPEGTIIEIDKNDLIKYEQIKQYLKLIEE